jgi:pyrophosphate--fructose-6-phosphate 1-phosphotransferase
MTSAFHRLRAAYEPRMPAALRELSRMRLVDGGAAGGSAAVELTRLFPKTWGKGLLRFERGGSEAPRRQRLTTGVVLSGGPAPGGHNVLWGLFEGLTQLCDSPRLLGFAGGPQGILDDQVRALDAAALAPYRNAGGFDAIGTGRTKIETEAQLARCREVLARHEVDALVVIGGDDSNTNAAILAESFATHASPVTVVGVPKTIDGDLRNPWVETSFGFDTAVRVYSEMIANIGRDVLSTRKYYHFVRLMGRSASHITLEAALQTQPNAALISEELAARKVTLRGLVDELSELIVRRAATGKDFGLILVPEGVIEFIPEFKALIEELNHLLAEHRDYIASLSGFTAQSEYVHRKLGKDASYTFSSLPIDIQRQLLMDRDPHGNVVVSRIETEKLFIELLHSRLGELKAEGRYVGRFGHQAHFLGYEGRCAAPTNFDADYAYALGHTAAALAARGASGYMAAVHGLTRPRAEWEPLGVPLASLLALETRHGKQKPVITKALVELDGKAFKHFAARRGAWGEGDHYRFAGPIQYFGPETLTDRVPCTLAVERDAAQTLSW